MPFLVHSWPQVILHIDGDAFFASCEQSLHPEYRGKPLVTGKERGIAAAFSYEAKRAGVKRGMRLFEVKKVCPECIIVPSDYEAYSLISKRMFDIVRQFCPDIEEYSIDEGFADLTGLRRPLRMSYRDIASSIKMAVERDLGISVSVGVSLSKSLAKLASNFRKPGGLTVVSGKHIDVLLQKTPIEEVWGIGPNTTALLRKYTIQTAYDFVMRSEEWVKKTLTKPGVEIWQELRGEYVYQVNPELKETYQSISKVKTFTPPTNDKLFIYGQLIRNLEKACIKARRYGLAAKRVSIILRHQDFFHSGCEVRLNRISAIPVEIAQCLKTPFEKIFDARVSYRMTGIVLHDLHSNATRQYSLFENPVQAEKIERIFSSIDAMGQKFGKHTLHIASSLFVDKFDTHLGERGDKPERKTMRVFGERGRKRLRLPYFFASV